MGTALYFLILTTICGVLAGYNNRYCNLEFCEGNPNTACIYNLNDIGMNCKYMLSTGLTAEEIDNIVSLHNWYRQLVASGQERRGAPGPQPPSNNIGPLQWSWELATIAQLWANQCRIEHDPCRDTVFSPVGQNLGLRSRTGPITRANVLGIVESWYEEVQNFDRNIVRSFRAQKTPKIGHYTQLVWGTTTHVGCGLSLYQPGGGWTNTTLVCNYAPSGNYLYQPVY